MGLLLLPAPPFQVEVQLLGLNDVIHIQWLRLPLLGPQGAAGVGAAWAVLAAHVVLITDLGAARIQAAVGAALAALVLGHVADFRPGDVDRQFLHGTTSFLNFLQKTQFFLSFLLCA